MLTRKNCDYLRDFIDKFNLVDINFSMKYMRANNALDMFDLHYVEHILKIYKYKNDKIKFLINDIMKELSIFIIWWLNEIKLL